MSTSRSALLIALAVLASSGSTDAFASSNWFRHPAVSPDGSQVVFCHGGDLFTVPIEGGRAVPLTVLESYETDPVWSHDGRWIAFASDRYGNFDVFVMPSEGGEAKRLTFHQADDLPSDFTVDDEAVIFESAREDDVASALFPSGVLSELYRVPLSGGTPQMLLTTPALNARFDTNGSRLLYEDRKGYEDPLRKHHTSSIARDVWMCDLGSGMHRKITKSAAEDRDPHWSDDQRSMYFLSERAGDFNVFRMNLDGGNVQQLTSFQDHPVRHLSRSPRTGDLVFSWHGDLYRLREGSQAEMIDIRIGVDTAGDEPRKKSESSGATEFAVSPNGKELAFVVRGEVFVTSVEFDTTRRITNTPEQERMINFAPDGRSLTYAGERDGSWNIYEASLADDDEMYFFSATSIAERPLVATEAEEFQPRYSPDGKSLAYLHNRQTLMVLDLESRKTVTVLPGDTYYSYEDGDHWFRWSPDSAWLAVHFYDRGRAFVPEVGLVAADGSTDMPIELSNSGYSDQQPVWAMDGGAVIWASDRYGERNHGGDGAESDVVGAFLTQDAFDRFRLSKEEYELNKEREKKIDKAKEEAEDEAKEAEPEKDEPQPVELELEGLEARTVRLTIHASDLGDFAMADDGGKLFYLAGFEKGYDLWVHDFREESTKILTKLGANDASMRLSDDGETIFLLANGSLATVSTESGEKKPVKFKAELAIDGLAERQCLLQHVWRQMKVKFYNPDMHGVDWTFYHDAYRAKLPGVTNNRDFADILSEMLGELNASHTGGRYRPPSEEGDTKTAALGVFFDNAYAGSGMRIAEVIEGGPLAKAELGIEAGMVITHIDGVTLDDSQNVFALLDGKEDERVRLTMLADGETTDKVVRPISLGAESQLLYERWVKSRRALVDELSGGRLAYMHVRGMNDASFRAFYSEVMGRHFDREALIVDTRFNGGGWLHDDLVTFLTGKPYVDLYPRSDEAPGLRYFGEPATRWTKPSVVVMSESNYSDAHFFPWAYTELAIGDTIGMPVPGTSTAVWWERLHTGDLIFGIPQVGTKGKSQTYLENDQLEPTYRVPLDPESAAAGRDTQIIKAVEVLLKTVDGN